MKRAVVLVGLLLLVATVGAVGMSIMPSSAVARFDSSGPPGMSHVTWQWNPGPPWNPSPGPVQQTVQVRMTDFAFEPSVVQVARSVPINLELVNAGSVTHTLVIPVLGTRAVVGPGERRIVRVGYADAGVYEFFCAIPAHRESGMIGRLIVGPGVVARDSR